MPELKKPPSGNRLGINVCFWGTLMLASGVSFGFNFREMWMRWFPAWHHRELSLYTRIAESESYYTHGPLVPLVSMLIFALLLRHARIPVRPARGWGFFLVGGSLLVHLLACLARVNFVSGFALIGLLAGMVLLLWGFAALRVLWFPLLFLFFMVPLPEVSIGQLNFRLKLLTADWGVRLAGLLGVTVEQAGNQVVLPGNKFLVIANVCNGLRTLITVIAFTALYSYICRLRGWWRLVLFSLSVPVAVISNMIRITSLIVVADIFSVEVATGWYHDFSGIMILFVAFLVLFGAEKLIILIRAGLGIPLVPRPLLDGYQRTAEDGAQGANLARALVSVRGGLLIVLLGASGFGASWLSRSMPSIYNRNFAAQSLPASFSLAGKVWHGYPLEIDRQTLMILETEDAVMERYVSAGQDPVDYCIVFSDDNRKGTHPPDVCLEGGGWDIIAKAQVDLPGLLPGQALPCQELIVQQGKLRMYYLYTYKCGPVYTRSFWKQQFLIFQNGLLNRNASGALIRISMPVTEDVPGTRARVCQSFAATFSHIHTHLP